MFLYLYFSILSFYSISILLLLQHDHLARRTRPRRRPFGAPPPQGLALHPPPAGHAGHARDAAPSLPPPPPPKVRLCNPPSPVETLAMFLSIFFDTPGFAVSNSCYVSICIFFYSIFLFYFYSIAAPARPPGTPDTPATPPFRRPPPPRFGSAPPPRRTRPRRCPLVAAPPPPRFGSATPPPRLRLLLCFYLYFSILFYSYSIAAPARRPGHAGHARDAALSVLPPSRPAHPRLLTAGPRDTPDTLDTPATPPPGCRSPPPPSPVETLAMFLSIFFDTPGFAVSNSCYVSISIIL